jgi:hypothetical protein
VREAWRADLRRAMGQLFFMGWEGTEVTPQIRTLIEDHHLGAILLTTKNLKSIWNFSLAFSRVFSSWKCQWLDTYYTSRVTFLCIFSHFLLISLIRSLFCLPLSLSPCTDLHSCPRNSQIGPGTANNRPSSWPSRAIAHCCRSGEWRRQQSFR